MYTLSYIKNIFYIILYNKNMCTKKGVLNMCTKYVY